MKDRRTIKAFPSGALIIPPSKSLSHRALICAALAELAGGSGSILYNVGNNEDTRATKTCLSNLGVNFETKADKTYVSFNKNKILSQSMDCAESGSTLRFMIPIAALYTKEFIFTGRGRLMERPMDIYEKIFKEKGIPFKHDGNKIILRGPLTPSDFVLRGDVSSQFISGMLFALPLLNGNSTLTLDTPLESSPYVDMTLDVMKHFGVDVDNIDHRTYNIPGRQNYRSEEYHVEGDWSQAAFFLAAGALGYPVKCQNLTLSSAQGDKAILDIIKGMGGTIAAGNNSFSALPSTLTSLDVDVREIPDLVPVLAVLCSLAKGKSRITGAGRLRHKESDRLDAITSELCKLGANIKQGSDELVIEGKEFLNGGSVDAHGDHRIAMALAVAGIKCICPVHLTGWQSVDKSYPKFWGDFEKEDRHG